MWNLKAKKSQVSDTFPDTLVHVVNIQTYLKRIAFILTICKDKISSFKNQKFNLQESLSIRIIVKRKVLIRWYLFHPCLTSIYP